MIKQLQDVTKRSRRKRAVATANCYRQAKCRTNMSDNYRRCCRTRHQQSDLFQTTCSSQTLAGDSLDCLNGVCAAWPTVWHQFPSETCFPRQPVPECSTVSLQSTQVPLCCRWTQCVASRYTRCCTPPTGKMCVITSTTWCKHQFIYHIITNQLNYNVLCTGCGIKKQPLRKIE